MLLLCCGVILAVGMIRAPAGALAAPAPPPPGPGPQALGNPIPRSGDQKLLIVLADFSDRPGSFTGQLWRQFFFGANGFADYYRRSSYNQLRYTGAVAGLNGTTPVTNSLGVAYVRLPHPISFYADGIYGYGSNARFPRNNGGVVRDALQALDAAGFDFAPYAHPTTKQVANLVVVFAGKNYYYSYDANGSLLATAYRLTWAGLNGPFIANGGYTFDNYTFCPEQRADSSMAYIGICAHEHGHGLGMFDTYDLSGTTSGVGYFDLMAYGTYAATDGRYPIGLSAFAKTFFGWVMPLVPAAGPTTLVLHPAEDQADFVKLYPNGAASSQEYFLLENRQPRGVDREWETPPVALCRGLVIWHVDEAVVQAYAFVNRVNTWPTAGGPPHPGVSVVEADGNAQMRQPPLNYGACGDTWRQGRTWSRLSTPNSRLWNGADSRVSVTVLRENADGSLTLVINVQTQIQTIYFPLIHA